MASAPLAAAAAIVSIARRRLAEDPRRHGRHIRRRHSHGAPVVVFSSPALLAGPTAPHPADKPPLRIPVECLAAVKRANSAKCWKPMRASGVHSG